MTYSEARPPNDKHSLPPGHHRLLEAMAMLQELRDVSI